MANVRSDDVEIAEAEPLGGIVFDTTFDRSIATLSRLAGYTALIVVCCIVLICGVVFL